MYWLVWHHGHQKIAEKVLRLDMHQFHMLDHGFDKLQMFNFVYSTSTFLFYFIIPKLNHIVFYDFYFQKFSVILLNRSKIQWIQNFKNLFCLRQWKSNQGQVQVAN